MICGMWCLCMWGVIMMLRAGAAVFVVFLQGVELMTFHPSATPKP